MVHLSAFAIQAVVIFLVIELMPCTPRGPTRAANGAVATVWPTRYRGNTLPSALAFTSLRVRCPVLLEIRGGGVAVEEGRGRDKKRWRSSAEDEDKDGTIPTAQPRGSPGPLPQPQGGAGLIQDMRRCEPPPLPLGLHYGGA